jgi:hypothetical protein
MKRSTAEDIPNDAFVERKARRTSMSSPAELFGRTYVINLPERTDRLKAITRELGALGMPLGGPNVELQVATRCTEPKGFPGNAVRGCFLSHLAILYKARSEALQSVLIMEDDLAISPSFGKECARLMEQADEYEWGFLYFGHIEAVAGTSPQLVPFPGPLGTTHFYAVNARIFDRLITYLEQVQSREPGDPAGGPMHYDGALTMFRLANPDIVTLIAQPNLGWQRSSRSDIHGAWYDRTAVLNKVADAARDARQKMRDWRAVPSRALNSRAVKKG